MAELMIPEVVGACPFPVASFAWYGQRQDPFITVLCKATFRLQPPLASIAVEQEPIFDVDVYSVENGQRRFVCPADMVPEKRFVDVILVGHAYAPKGEAVDTLTARLAVDTLDKTVEIYSDRTQRADGAIQSGQPFRRMPLVYERSAGGPDTDNPVGISSQWSPAGRRLANIVPPRTRFERGSDPPQPIGFGPIASDWPTRRGRIVGQDVPADWTRSPRALPAGFDISYFNAAPSDQQLGDLPPILRLTLEQLHPDLSRLVTELPLVLPVATIQGAGNVRGELPLRCDTLWIDTDRAICTLTFRGVRPLNTMPADARITVQADVPDSERKRPPERGVTRDLDRRAIAEALRDYLPFSKSRTTEIAVEPATPPRTTVGTPVAPAAPPRSSPGLEPVRLAQAHHAPPPRSSQQAAVQLRDSPARPALLSLMTQGESDYQYEDDAALPAAPPPPRATLGEGELLDLIWFDAASMPRIRRRRIWRSILDEVEQAPVDPELDSAELSFTPAQVENRRDLGAIATRAVPLRPDAFRAVLAEGIYGGTFSAKTGLFEGQLVMAWDETTLLRALVIATTPLCGDSPPLRGAVAAASEYLAIPGLFAAPRVAAGLAAQIVEVLRQGRRAVPAEVIEMHAEQATLQQRGYQRRNVFGGMHLKGYLHGEPNTAGAPVYLPEGVAALLPLFQRFKARLLCEVHPPCEQQETFGAAFRVLAVARVLSL